MTEDQKKIRDQCGMVCAGIGQNPNAIAPEKYRAWAFGYLDNDKPVRAWMLWITTVEAGNQRRARQKLEADGRDKATLERRAYLARLIEETNPGSQKRFEYHTQNY